MKKRAKLLKELVQDSFYVVDPQAVADAIMLRARVRSAVPEMPFRSQNNDCHIRSFRHEQRARSFRLSASFGLRAQSG
jgi:hypothetical protein